MENEDKPRMNIDAEQLKKLEEEASEKGIPRDEAVARASIAELFKKT